MAADVRPWTFIRGALGRAVTSLREGRLELSPAIWLVHLRNYRRELEAAPPAPVVPTGGAGDAKAAIATLYAAMLGSFLGSSARLVLPTSATPAISIVIALFNRAELTFRCLRSIVEHSAVPLEVILVDNASSDETRLLCARVDGARVLLNETNVGFLRAINQAARVARGRALLILNSDTELLPGSLAAALDLLDRHGDVGAVGGPLISLEGRLQEAGSVIWSDGSCLGYGRGDAPLAPPYTFQRDVDYVSGAFLLTRRALFLELGGFDRAYVPAYYEDADYCVRLWKAGHRVVYEPRAAVVHFEFASSRSTEQALAMQRERRVLFSARHAGWLRAQPAAAPTDPRAVLAARARPGTGLRILYLDDRVPLAVLGGGNPRSVAVLTVLARLGHFATILPLSFPREDTRAARADLPGTFELFAGGEAGAGGLAAHLDERRGYYDVIWASRPHNLMRLNRALAGSAASCPPIVYDSEAVAALRDDAPAPALESELAEARSARVVVAVSEAERVLLSRATGAPSFTLGHGLRTRPTPRPFALRRGLLFVGALVDEASPNVDSVLWFCAEVLPLLGPIEIDLVGATALDKVLGLRARHPLVRVVGQLDVAELEERYDRSRLFIAPTRIAAGIPHKVHEAAAHGLPVVCTSILAAQLGWRDRDEISVADTPADFAAAIARLDHDGAAWERQREKALARVVTDCSPERFERTVAEILRAAMA